MYEWFLWYKYDLMTFDIQQSREDPHNTLAVVSGAGLADWWRYTPWDTCCTWTDVTVWHVGTWSPTWTLGFEVNGPRWWPTLNKRIVWPHHLFAKHCNAISFYDIEEISLDFPEISPVEAVLGDKPASLGHVDANVSGHNCRSGGGPPSMT